MKAFIYDMDGVIADTEPVHLAAEHAVMAELGVDVPMEELISHQGTTNEQLFAAMTQKRGMEVSVAELCRRKQEMFQRAMEKDGVTPIEGILALIEKTAAMPGVRTAIASSSSDAFIAFVVDRLGIRDKFDLLVSGTNLPESKPNPAIYLLAARRLGVAPQDCVVLEDTHNGALAAKGAGMKCIGFRSPHSGRQDFSMVDCIVERIADIRLEDF